MRSIQKRETKAAPALSQVDRIVSAAKGCGLTPREVDIVQLLAEGDTRKAIADKLKCSPRTVDAHIGRIFIRLRVRNSIRVVSLLLSA